MCVFVCVTAVLTFPQCTLTSLSFFGSSFEAANTQDTKLWWRPQSGACTCVGGSVESIDMFYMCLCWQRAAERHVIFGERPLTLASCWPLTQIKLPMFSPFPLLSSSLFSSLNLSLLPTARHFCFHMADFSGNTLIFVAFGVGSRVCCACQIFFTPTYPSTQIELFSNFLSSPLNHLPILYFPMMSNFIVESDRAKTSCPIMHPFLYIIVAHAECIKKVAFKKHDHQKPL